LIPPPELLIFLIPDLISALVTCREGLYSEAA